MAQDIEILGRRFAEFSAGFRRSPRKLARQKRKAAGATV